jgi:hypothetical protein
MMKTTTPKEIWPSGQRSSNVFATRSNCMTKYTAMEMAFNRYNTTNKPVVFWGPIEPHDLKVASEITNERANIAAEGTRINHTERAVPSSYS